MIEPKRAKVARGVIAAAGRGSRMHPGTKSYCKELLPLPRTPAIANVAIEMSEAGIAHITIVVREDNCRAIETLFDPAITAPDNVRHDAVVQRFENAIKSTSFNFVKQSGRY